MAAPFRIERRLGGIRGRPDEAFRHYLERLLKMIPAEVVGLYMVGSGFIPEDQAMGSALWAAICLGLLSVLRIYGTADPSKLSHHNLFLYLFHLWRL